MRYLLIGKTSNPPHITLYICHKQNHPILVPGWTRTLNYRASFRSFRQYLRDLNTHTLPDLRMAGEYSMYDSAAPTVHSMQSPPKQIRTEHLKRPQLPFVALQRPLTPTEFEHAPEYYVRVANERQQAEAALDGSRAFRQTDDTLLPAYLRELQCNASSSSSARVRQHPGSYTQRDSQAGPPYPSNSACQPYRSGTSYSTCLPTDTCDTRLSSQALHSKNHSRLSRAIEHCDFDSDPFMANSTRRSSVYTANHAGSRMSGYPAPSNEMSPESNTEESVGLSRSRVDERSIPALPALPGATSTMNRSEVHYENAAPEPACEKWRPQSWNVIRDLKECLSGREGLRRQLLKEHYRRPRD